MRAPPDSQPGNGFVAGFLSALLLLAVLAGLSRTVAWAATTDVVARVHAWWTTPQPVVPADVVGSLLTVVVFVLLSLAIVSVVRYMGRTGWRI